MSVVKIQNQVGGKDHPRRPRSRNGEIADLDARTASCGHPPRGAEGNRRSCGRHFGDVAGSVSGYTREIMRGCWGLDAAPRDQTGPKSSTSTRRPRIASRTFSAIPCTVGASGTSLNITADGWGAGQACQQMTSLAANVNGLGSPYPTNAFGQVVCVVKLGTIEYTVRDTGIFEILGNGVCQYLQQQTPRQGQQPALPPRLSRNNKSRNRALLHSNNCSSNGVTLGRRLRTSRPASLV